MLGNIPLLGHWDTSKAVFLNTTQSTYPEWSIKIDLPRDKIIEYKYLIIKDPNAAAKRGQKPVIVWE